MQIKIALLASAVLASAHWTTIITPPSVTAVPNANAGPATTDENITHGGLDWSSSDDDNFSHTQPETFAAPAGSNQGSGGLLTSLENLLGGSGGNSNGLLSGLLGDGNHDGLLAALLGPDGLLTNLLGTNHRNGLLSGLLGSDGNGLTGLLKKLLEELTGPNAGPPSADRSAVISALQAITEADAPKATNPGGAPTGTGPSPNGAPLPDLASYDDSSCSTGSKISCCDTSSAKTNGLLGNILGGSCDLPQLLFANNHCAADEVFCCPTDQDGFLNLSASCVPITL
jgi:hypothetical protein